MICGGNQEIYYFSYNGFVVLFYDIFYGMCTRHLYDTYVVSSATMWIILTLLFIEKKRAHKIHIALIWSILITNNGCYSTFHIGPISLIKILKTNYILNPIVYGWF